MIKTPEEARYILNHSNCSDICPVGNFTLLDAIRAEGFLAGVEYERSRIAPILKAIRRGKHDRCTCIGPRPAKKIFQCLRCELLELAEAYSREESIGADLKIEFTSPMFFDNLKDGRE